MLKSERKGLYDMERYMNFRDSSESAAVMLVKASKIEGSMVRAATMEKLVNREEEMGGRTVSYAVQGRVAEDAVFVPVGEGARLLYEGVRKVVHERRRVDVFDVHIIINLARCQSSRTMTRHDTNIPLKKNTLVKLLEATIFHIPCWRA